MYDWSFSGSAPRADEERSVSVDDARVVPGPECLGARALREGEKRVEAEDAVATRAGVRSRAGRVAGRERIDDGLAELLTEIERDVRQRERVTRRPRGGHGLGRAARSLGGRPLRVLPEAKRHAHGVRLRAQERDRAVHASAHRDRDPTGRGLGGEHLAERCGERLHGERFAAGRGSLEQRQPGERPLEPVAVRLDDAVAFDREPDRAPLARASRISEDVDPGHALRLDQDVRELSAPPCR